MKSVKLLPQDTEELGKAGARDLKVPEVPQDAWTHAFRLGRVREALEPPNLPGYEAFIRCLRQHRKQHPELWPILPAQSVARTDSAPRRLLGKGDLVRARYETAWISELAREHHTVSEVRTKLLKGRILAPSEASALLNSIAVTIMQPMDFELHGIPLIGHTSTVCLPDGNQAVACDEHLVIRIRWGESNTVDIPYHRAWHEQLSERPIEVPVTNDGVQRSTRRVVERSVLWQVGQSSQWLAQAFFPWRRFQALWFLLTDIPPDLTPTRTQASIRVTAAGHRAEITLFISPWMRADRVAAIYKDAQLQYFKKPRRTPSLSKLKLYDFVKPFREETPPRPWKDIKRLWRRDHPNERSVDVDQFQRAYQRTRRWVEQELLWPQYKMLLPPSPAQRRRAERALGNQRPMSRKRK